MLVLFDPGIVLYLKAFENSTSYLMLFSSLSFLMASWARAEIIVFIIVSFLYLFLVKQKERFKKLFYFAGPIIFIIILVGLYIYLTGNSTIKAHLRLNEFVTRLLYFYVQYKEPFAIPLKMKPFCIETKWSDYLFQPPGPMPGWWLSEHY